MMERRKSHRIHADALDDLERIFRATQYPTNEQLTELADRHLLNIEKIRNWFNNRKAKEKRIHDQEFAEKIRSMPISKDVFDLNLDLQSGDSFNLLSPSKLDWEVYVAMKERILQLQKLLADATQNQHLIVDQQSYLQNSLIKYIHNGLINSMSNITDYRMERTINLSRDTSFVNVFQIFFDVYNVGQLDNHSQDIEFQLEKNILKVSYFYKKLNELGRITANVKLDSLGFSKSLEQTRMDVDLESIKLKYDNKEKIVYLHIQVGLKPYV
eukprot:NODE_244_length_13037_cov_0.560442.p5 type:complete len:270 gc:universal NODE_244_length_13037_cov_0.560442:733-1542(+)